MQESVLGCKGRLQKQEPVVPPSAASQVRVPAQKPNQSLVEAIAAATRSSSVGPNCPAATAAAAAATRVQLLKLLGIALEIQCQPVESSKDALSGWRSSRQALKGARRRQARQRCLKSPAPGHFQDLKLTRLELLL
eukprot:CAMPEP_0115108368 /NCGR_PEP_ID=MMETSP0227-20121206/37961_1 /TAXON_ID=89957 /ORGANISM="Polarella glacialis, Strain CCMP 1383" /LENGTH=135 /DNA_ID=CAMNT_0002506647 /DNA_START=515 /DNA_END=923 /DNA_ORIENTATION=+